MPETTRFIPTNPHPTNKLANDCAVRAHAIAFDVPYAEAMQTVATEVAKVKKISVEEAVAYIYKSGTPNRATMSIMRRAGWKFVNPSKNKYATGHRVTFRPEFMPANETVIIHIRNHLAAVVKWCLAGYLSVERKDWHEKRCMATL